MKGRKWLDFDFEPSKYKVDLKHEMDYDNIKRSWRLGFEM